MKGNLMHCREEVARKYGFETIGKLLERSKPLPLLPGDTSRAYVARRPDGTWFVWVDPLKVEMPVTCG
jgi:hypothetical protein